MKKNMFPFVCLSLGALVSHSTLAEDNIERSGFWIGTGIGMSEFSSSLISVNGIEPFSGKLDAGYDLNNHIGFYVSQDYINSTFMSESMNLSSFGLIGRTRFNYEWSLIGKVASTFLHGGINEGFTTSYGVGLEYQLTHAIASRLGVDFYEELHLPSNVEFDTTQIYWGLTYRFGQPDTPMVITKTVEVIKEIPVEVKVIKEVVKEIDRDMVSFGSSYVLFENNSYIPVSTKPLESLWQTLKKAPSLSIRIVGYTDSTGSAKYNQWMSERRAQFIGQYFIQYGITVDRVMVEARGELEPIANNNTESGRAQNRRVELFIN